MAEDRMATHPYIRTKLRMVICDGLLAQCHGGPAHHPKWAWPWGGIIVGADPVAVDRVGTDVVEARRREVGLPPLAQEGRAPAWLETAERLGLGTQQTARIQQMDESVG